MNEAVLQAIEQHALTPEAVEQVIALTERDDVRDIQMALTRERRDVAKRIDRLVKAVEGAGDIASPEASESYSASGAPVAWDTTRIGIAS